MIERERILNGSDELFLQAGIKSVTMDDVARHLGVSKKTIYQVFKDKSELVTALVQMRLNTNIEAISTLMSNTGNMIGELLNLDNCAREIFSRVNPIVLHDLQRYYPEAWQLFQQFKTGFLVSVIEKLLNKGIAQGYIRPNLDVKIMAVVRVNQIELGFNQQVFPLAVFNMFDVQNQLMQHFNHGICTPKGIAALSEFEMAVR
jgi:AcrR family transcriptional regulator